MTSATLGDFREISFLQEPGADGLGNVIRKCEGPQGTWILKQYRRRWPRLQEFTEAIVARWVLGLTGGSARARHAAEKRSLELWSAEGFDVLRRIDAPIPAEIRDPAIWLEYCPGRTLAEILIDEGVPWSEKTALLGRLGGELRRRHRRALELEEPMLIQKHGTLQHVLLFEQRMITIDLEGAYRPGFPMREALTRELSGYLRSLAKSAPGQVDEAFRCLIEAYGDRDRLREIADWGVHGKSHYRFFTRRQDRKRRAEHGKTEVLRRLLRLLGNS